MTFYVTSDIPVIIIAMILFKHIKNYCNSANKNQLEGENSVLVNIIWLKEKPRTSK